MDFIGNELDEYDNEIKRGLYPYCGRGLFLDKRDDDYIIVSIS